MKAEDSTSYPSTVQHITTPDRNNNILLHGHYHFESITTTITTYKERLVGHSHTPVEGQLQPCVQLGDEKEDC